MDALTHHNRPQDSDDATAALVSPGKYDKLLTVGSGSPDASKPTPGTALVVVPNRVALDQALADRLNRLQKDEQNARIALARVACDIRRQYLAENGAKYAPEFTSFWKNFRMEATFGKLPQFTKYASAGDLIQRVEQHHREYAALLPDTIKALYALSLLKDDDLGEFLKCHSEQSREKAPPKRSSQKKGKKALPNGSGGKKPKAAAEPSGNKEVPCSTPITDASVKAWLKAKQNPQPEQPKETFIRLAEIKIHGSFGSFAEDGSYLGKMSKTQLEQLVAAIRTAVSSFDPSLVEAIIHDTGLMESYAAAEKKTHGKKASLGTISRRAHLDQVEAWLLHCLRPVKWNAASKERRIPSTALKIIDRLGLDIEIQDGLTKRLPSSADVPMCSFIKPTMNEFVGALCREFLEKTDARSLLAVVARALRQGAWAETVKIYSPSAKRSGMTREVSKLEHDLGNARATVKDRSASNEAREAARERVAEITSYLPPMLAALSAEEQLTYVRDWIDACYGEGKSD